MRKTLLVLGIVALLISAFPMFAADSDSEEMHIKVQIAFVGISLYEDDGSTPYTDWNIGITSELTAHTMTPAEHMEAVNEGNATVDLSVYSDDLGTYSCGFGTETNWSPGAGTGVDQYTLECGEGTDVAPAVTFITCPLDATPGTDVVTGLASTSTAHLYHMFTTPTSVSDGCEHDITVTVLATLP